MSDHSGRRRNEKVQKLRSINVIISTRQYSIQKYYCFETCSATKHYPCTWTGRSCCSTSAVILLRHDQLTIKNLVVKSSTTFNHHLTISLTYVSLNMRFFCFSTKRWFLKNVVSALTEDAGNVNSPPRYHTFSDPAHIELLRSQLLTWYDQEKRELPWRSLVTRT